MTMVETLHDDLIQQGEDPEEVREEHQFYCMFCGGPATGIWMTKHDGFMGCCPKCAKEKAPLFIADAIVGGMPDGQDGCPLMPPGPPADIPGFDRILSALYRGVAIALQVRLRRSGRKGAF